MSNFKKFTEFCAGISAFTALMYIFRNFMSFSPEEVESTKEKIKLFFSSNATKDYLSLAFLAVLLILAITAALIFWRRPEIPFVFSCLSLFFSIYLFNADKLFERPMLYIVLSSVQVVGNLYEAITRDRQDGKKRSFWLANFSAALCLGFCLLIKWREKELARLTEAELFELKPFDSKLKFMAEDFDTSLFWVIAAIYAVLIAVSLILRGVHFIDFALSLVPLVYILYKQNIGLLGPHTEILATAAVVCCICRLALTVTSVQEKQAS